MPELTQTPRLRDGELPISTLALAPSLDTGGTYPQAGPGPAINVMAMVHILAGKYPAFGATPCAGAQLPINTHQALFSLLGVTYGGDPLINFAVPDLRQRLAVGRADDQPMPGQGLPFTYLIAAQAGAGAPPAFPMVGAIGLFAGINAPPGWLVADGSLYPLSRQIPLFEVIGNTFGGDGVSTFALPDLRGRTVVGAGQGASASIALGQVVEAGPDTPVACVGLNYIINVSGALPPNQGNGGFPNSASVLGEVVAFGGSSIPAGWVPAQGQEMLIAGNEALFEIVGSAFGGDGKTSFALPDLRTRLVVGG